VLSLDACAWLPVTSGWWWIHAAPYHDHDMPFFLFRKQSNQSWKMGWQGRRGDRTPINKYYNSRKNSVSGIITANTSTVLNGGYTNKTSDHIQPSFDGCLQSHQIIVFKQTSSVPLIINQSPAHHHTLRGKACRSRLIVVVKDTSTPLNLQGKQELTGLLACSDKRKSLACFCWKLNQFL
jgi:hypothetical protein